MKRSAKNTQRFLCSEAAAVTAEFVIILPVVLALVFLIVFVSLYISAASDLQQIAHDLARYSFRFAGRTEAGNLCPTLQNTILPVLIDASLILRQDSFTLVSCDIPAGSDGLISIAVRYDFAGSYVQSIGNLFGLNIGILNRTSSFML